MKIIKKIIAVVLCVMMVFGNFPMSISYAAEATGNIAAGTAVTDASTINTWKEFFLSGNNGKADTLNAGGVWTDKSVIDNEDGTMDIILSAIANKNVVTEEDKIGYDVVFILDHTGSMKQSVAGKPKYQMMVNTVNSAIDILMNNNEENRSYP